MIMCVVPRHGIDATRHWRPADRLVCKSVESGWIDILVELRARGRSAGSMMRKNMSVDSFIRKPNRPTAVVYEHGGVAGHHIVRVDGGDGEVSHVLGAGVVADGGNYGCAGAGDLECRAGFEVFGVGPGLGSCVPERVVLSLTPWRGHQR